MTPTVLCISLATMHEVPTFPAESVLCLGNFDGVHLAHRRLIRATRRLRDEQAPSAALGAFCFRVPTSEYLSETPVPQLSSIEDKLRIFREEGLEYAYLADFLQLRELSPEKFATSILFDLCHCRALACGFNHRFGKGGAGTPSLLASLLGIPVTVLPEETLDGVTVSSTHIRRLLLEGSVEKATQMLTAPYCLTSPVIHGKALGRRRGIPTVNQNFPPRRLIPRHGVYLSRCCIDGLQFWGLSNIGTHPTVDSDAGVNCETYLLDCHEDLYGKDCSVSFLQFLRPEQTFPSEDALYQQIEQDIASARDRIQTLLPSL